MMGCKALSLPLTSLSPFSFPGPKPLPRPAAAAATHPSSAFISPISFLLSSLILFLLFFSSYTSPLKLAPPRTWPPSAQPRRQLPCLFFFSLPSSFSFYLLLPLSPSPQEARVAAIAVTASGYAQPLAATPSPPLLPPSHYLSFSLPLTY